MCPKPQEFISHFVGYNCVQKYEVSCQEVHVYVCWAAGIKEELGERGINVDGSCGVECIAVTVFGGDVFVLRLWALYTEVCWLRIHHWLYLALQVMLDVSINIDEREIQLNDSRTLTTLRLNHNVNCWQLESSTNREGLQREWGS